MLKNINSDEWTGVGRTRLEGLVNVVQKTNLPQGNLMKKGSNRTYKGHKDWKL